MSFLGVGGGLPGGRYLCGWGTGSCRSGSASIANARGVLPLSSAGAWRAVRCIGQAKPGRQRTSAKATGGWGMWWANEVSQPRPRTPPLRGPGRAYHGGESSRFVPYVAIGVYVPVLCIAMEAPIPNARSRGLVHFPKGRRLKESSASRCYPVLPALRRPSL